MTKLIMYLKKFDTVDDISVVWQLIIDLINIAIIILAVYVVMMIAVRIVKKILEKSSLDDVSYRLIIRVTKVGFLIAMGLGVLLYLKVDMSPFVAVLATAGAAIALALKDSLSNVAGGIIMLFTKPFVKGDEINVEGVEGIVDYIDLMNTSLHTLDNKTVIIPNAKIVSSVVTNYTDADVRRLEVTFSIGYNVDIDMAKEVIAHVIASSDMFLAKPKPVIGIYDHLDSALAVDVKVWIRTEDRFDARYLLYEEVKKEFDRAGIEIPYPQLDVHLPKSN